MPMQASGAPACNSTWFVFLTRAQQDMGARTGIGFVLDRISLKYFIGVLCGWPLILRVGALGLGGVGSGRLLALGENAAVGPSESRAPRLWFRELGTLTRSAPLLPPPCFPPGMANPLAGTAGEIRIVYCLWGVATWDAWKTFIVVSIWLGPLPVLTLVLPRQH